MKRSILVIFLVLVISACSDPVPDDKKEYVGEWEGENIYLLILANGRIEYERRANSGNVSIEAPIKEFVGDDFVVGIWFFDTTFKVSQPPNEEAGEWVMVVDGVRLVRN
ncbi:membrane lipoprotein lipid attachment site-containing protein [Pleionea sp. CnH1-48]|uniref:membrane lipoprotein lipid attachment site-containing protein n=1 Tax=Pleionea sp. CnH1-48 TaxID=2954494 RepID=UPI002096C70C|nr:membrane lipoprotein lipid attachment site-containing protein [Pleionea sp. CnH1-48]MCO7225984.1 membrane lipoprotein lipid attachment site-containing protein [Pleionea sp. CnH1-48]